MCQIYKNNAHLQVCYSFEKKKGKWKATSTIAEFIFHIFLWPGDVVI